MRTSKELLVKELIPGQSGLSMPKDFGIPPLEKTVQFSQWWAAQILATGWQQSQLCAPLVCYLLVGRSVERDLETQMVVVTSNDGLRDRLQQERDALFKFGTPVTAQVNQYHPLCFQSKKLAFYISYRPGKNQGEQCPGGLLGLLGLPGTSSSLSR